MKPSYSHIVGFVLAAAMLLTVSSAPAADEATFRDLARTRLPCPQLGDDHYFDGVGRRLVVGGGKGRADLVQRVAVGDERLGLQFSPGE